MKRILFLITLFSLALPLFAQDSTVRGGFVEYRYLGGKVYEAKLSLYVSCPSADVTPYIACRVGADTISGDTLVFVEARDVTGIPADCPVQSKCSGDTAAVYGVMRLSWTRRFDLDTFSHCSVLFYAYAGKRDAGITTGSKGEVFYIDSWLDQCQAPGSSSPSLAGSSESRLMIRNEDYVFNFGTSGFGDFDSVSYIITAGRKAYSTSISYIGNYAPSRPICYFGLCNPFYGPCPQNWPLGFHLDPHTGDIMFRPTSLCFGPIAIEISLWKRNGSAMSIASKLYREQAVQIIPSGSNHTPKILPPYSMQVCAGQQSCMTIPTDDDDAGDSVFLSLESDIPGLSQQISYNQYGHARAQVCWTPDSTQISNVPYTFLVKATDDKCGMPGKAVRAFSIFVRETPKAQTSIVLEDCGRVIVSAIPEKPNPSIQYQWKIIDSLGKQVALSSRASDTLLLKPGKYRSLFSINKYPCTETYSDSFIIADYNHVQLLTDPLVCQADTIKAKAVNSENLAVTYIWSKQYGPSLSAFTGDSAQYLADSTHYLRLTVKWGAYCQSSDSFRVKVMRPKKELTPTYPGFCFGDSTQLSVKVPVDSFAYLWSTGDTSRNIRVSKDGWYKLTTTYFPGCAQNDSTEVKAYSLPRIRFIAPDSICPGDSVMVGGTITGAFPFQYFWQDSSMVAPISTGGWSTLRVTDANACRNADSHFIAHFVIPQPAGSIYTVCRGHGFRFLSTDTLGTHIFYSFGDSGNYVVPQNSGPAIVSLHTADGCRADFPIAIVVNELPDPAFSYSVLTERNLLFIPANQWNTYYHWDFGDSSTSSQMIVNHTFPSNGPHSVRLLVTDRTTGCADSSEQTISFQVGIASLAETGISVYPNPFGETLLLQSPLAGTCRIYSALGHLVWEGQVKPAINLELDASGWKSGVYLLRLQTEQGQSTEKLIRR